MTFFPIFFIAIGIVNLLLFRVNAKGYVIDAENGMPLNMRQTVYGNDRSRASVPSRIELNGDFGAVSLSFRSKEKRDELYLALVRIHHIGGLIPTG